MIQNDRDNIHDLDDRNGIDHVDDVDIDLDIDIDMSKNDIDDID